MQFAIEGTVTYTFTPNKATEATIKEYAQANKCTLAQALCELYVDGDVRLYEESCGRLVESDYSTEDIQYDGSEAENAEFEDWG